MDASSVPERSELMVFWRRLRPFIQREWWRYSLGAFFAILTLGSAVAFPQLVRIVVDQGIDSGSTDRIHFWASLMAGVLVVGAVAAFLRTYLFELAALRASVAIQEQVFANLVVQEAGFFDAETAGEISSRLNTDVARLTFALANVLPEAVQMSMMGAVAGGLMVHTSPTLSLVVALVAPIIWGGTTVVGRVLRRQTSLFQRAYGELNVAGLEAFSAIQTVRAYHQERAEIDRFAERAQGVIDPARRRARANALLRSFTDLLSEGAVLLAIWVGGTLIVAGSLTPGTLVTFILYAAMVVRSLRSASSVLAGIMTAQGATDRIFWLGERRTRMPIAGGRRPERVVGDIRFEDVHFVYPTRPDSAALRGVTLEIPRGEVLAIVGGSGSGKSTIAKLAARLYDPDSGRVLLDGQDVRELDPEFFRRHVTLVPAEAVLFARSVADNIRYGRPDASEAEVEEAARIAHADGFVRDLPEAYETNAGDRGQLLSSGQRQRIGIARAVLRQPEVLLLDEATAALDAEGESLVKNALRALPHRPTIVIVSHRLSTVIDADRVLLVREGRVAAAGTHPELLESSPEYRSLFESQLVGEQEPREAAPSSTRSPRGAGREDDDPVGTTREKRPPRRNAS